MLKKVLNTLVFSLEMHTPARLAVHFWACELDTKSSLGFKGLAYERS